MLRLTDAKCGKCKGIPAVHVATTHGHILRNMGKEFEHHAFVYTGK